jgi:hypothetical protein
MDLVGVGVVPPPLYPDRGATPVRSGERPSMVFAV